HRAADRELQGPDSPFQDAHIGLAAMTNQPGNKAAEPRGISALPWLLPPPPAAREMDPRVEVPSDQQNAVPGLEHGLLDQIEIGLRIDDDAQPRCPGVAPDAWLHGS